MTRFTIYILLLTAAALIGIISGYTAVRVGFNGFPEGWPVVEVGR